MSRRSRIWCLALGLLAASPVLAGAELVLEDGRVLRGADVRRAGGEYELVLDSGEVLSIPAALVVELRLTGDDEDEEGETERAPSGLTYAEPRTLAGPEVEPPTPSEQLAVFGKPAAFAPSVIGSGWRPTSDWSNNPRQNDFNPARWAASVIDPTWVPRSGFTEKDVLSPDRSTWQESIIDPTWNPTDGFGGTTRRGPR